MEYISMSPLHQWLTRHAKRSILLATMLTIAVQPFLSLNVSAQVSTSTYYTQQGIQTYDASGTQKPACVVTLPTGTGGDVPAAGSPAESVFKFLINQGLTAQQAAGVVGNLMAETGGGTFALKPEAENSIGAYGIVQWLGGRKTNLQKIANYNTLTVQINFMWSEFNGPYASVFESLKSSTSTASATWVILTRYEIPCLIRNGGCVEEQANRLKYAEDAFNAFSALSPSPSASVEFAAYTDTNCEQPTTPGTPTTSPAGSLGDSSIPCAKNTTDIGLVRTRFTGNSTLQVGSYPTIRLCQLSGIGGYGDNTSGTRISGGAVVNAAVSGQFQTMGEAAKQAGKPLSASSSFRLGDSAGGNGDGVMTAAPGGSIHQIGGAIDFAIVPRNGNKSIQSCSARATSTDAQWVWLHANAFNFGIKQYMRESWHWDVLDNSTRCA